MSTTDTTSDAATIDRRAWRRTALVWAALAFTVRLVQLVREPAYLHPDALYQALEPAFRLVWGHGHVAWEFREGLRSWAWPGLVALPMALCKATGIASVGDGLGMAPAIAAARGLVAAIDVAALLLASRLAWRRGGMACGWTVALVLALHPAFVVMGAQPLVEVPAAALLAWACEHALGHAAIDRARALRLGVALGCAAMVRLQLVPALFVLALALAWRSRTGALRWDAGARMRLGVAVLATLLAFGALDWLTWGAPFHSARAYLAFNLGGGAETFGTMPIDRYWRDLGLALPGLGVAVLALGLVAVRREPWLALVVLAVVLPHQLVGYRVWRFVHPALPLAIVLAVLGASTLLRALERRIARPLALGLALATAGATVLAWIQDAPWQTTWLFDRGGWPAIERARGLDRAMLVLSSRPAPTAVVQAVLPAPGAPGIVLLGHDVRVIHVVGNPPDPETLVGVDAWIIGPELESPPDLAVVYEDPATGVRLVIGSTM